jgi:hypothetical protein
MASVNRPSGPSAGSGGFSDANQAAVINAFNSSTYISDQVDVQDTPVYDTVTIAAGGTVSNNTVSFFTTPQGAGSGKTLAQTNMVTGGKLNAPEAFSIMSFRLRWSENILPADLYAILNGFAFQFTIGTKPYQTGPLWNYNAGGGIFGSLTNTTASTVTSLLSNGNPGRMHMHRLAIPLVIENQATFYGNFVGNPITLTGSGSGGTGATLQMMLCGLYARGVQ